MAEQDVQLSPQELLVVKGFVDGLTYRQVATRMKVGYETVKAYAARIRRKLNVRSKTEIVVWALRKEVA